MHVTSCVLHGKCTRVPVHIFHTSHICVHIFHTSRVCTYSIHHMYMYIFHVHHMYVYLFHTSHVHVYVHIPYITRTCMCTYIPYITCVCTSHVHVCVHIFHTSHMCMCTYSMYMYITCMCTYIPYMCRTHEYEQKVQLLSSQLEDMKERLKVAEEQNSRAPPALLRLQKEMERTRVRSPMLPWTPNHPLPHVVLITRMSSFFLGGGGIYSLVQHR